MVLWNQQGLFKIVISNKSMEKAYNQIITRIAKIYDKYEEVSRQQTENQRIQKGAKIDDNQTNFIKQINDNIEPNIMRLLDEMKSSPNMKGELKDCVRVVNDCSGDIQKIKKKTVMFKINDVVKKLIIDTKQQIGLIRNAIGSAGNSGFLCCGTDGAEAFRRIFDHFKIKASQWQLLSTIQPKDSVQNFYAPKFHQNQYNFISQIIKNNWPEPKYVEKVVTINNGKPDRLNTANQFIFGINRQQNPEYGLKMYIEEADQNSNSSASSFLGQVYEDGILLEKDFKKAIKYYQKAMNGKQPYASYRFAMSLIRGNFSEKGQSKQSIQQGFKILNQSATELKSPQSYVELGVLYETGYFTDDKGKLFKVEKDLKKAIEYYKKARQLNIPRASNNLGVLYYNNRSMNPNDPNTSLKTQANMKENVKTAIKYFEEANDFGFGQSFFNLGSMYEKGLYVQKDLQKTLDLYYRGALKGDSKCKIKFAYELMNQTSIYKEDYEQHYRLAIRWLETVINKLNIKEEQTKKINGNFEDDLESKKDKAEAMYYLGLIYQYGFGVDQSPKRAFNYYIQSVNLQHPPALNKLGDCYFSGYAVKQDVMVAMGYYKQAADAQNSDALVNLGTIHLNGIPDIAEQNYTLALQYFAKAVDLHNSDALVHLSFMYKKGLGVDVDKDGAKSLLQKASIWKNSTARYMLKQDESPYTSRVLHDNMQQSYIQKPKNKINLSNIVPVIEHPLEKQKTVNYVSNKREQNVSYQGKEQLVSYR